MCLYVKAGHSYSTPHINPIAWIVWKMLNNGSETFAYSPYRGHKYVFGEVKKTARLEKYSCRQKSRGYHSYHFRWQKGLYPAIIPPGSEVFFGDYNELVSNRLVVFKNMQQMNQWLKNGGHL